MTPTSIVSTMPSSDHAFHHPTMHSVTHQLRLTDPILKGELLEDVIRHTPMGRVGEVVEVAAVVAFLCM
jgi:hypothetical protein